MPEVYEPGMHVDHIVASKHGGAMEEKNLALACSRCNRYKGPNIAGIDPQSGEVTRLFHPRRDVWSENFEWLTDEPSGKTPLGRATTQVLAINAPDIRAARAALMLEARFIWD